MELKFWFFPQFIALVLVMQLTLQQLTYGAKTVTHLPNAYHTVAEFMLAGSQ